MANESSISLRSFPYPYKAALSICSDIDLCPRHRFIALHKLINCPKTGLGLPVADSFFGMGNPQRQLSYLMPDGKTKSCDAAFIEEAIACGLIDTIHSWGDFNGCSSALSAVRQHAERIADNLQKRGLSIPVWVNHGGAENRQNFYARLRQGFSGDDPETLWYTANIARNQGIRYYWDNELVQWPLSGKGAGFRWLKKKMIWENILKSLVKSTIGRKSFIRDNRIMHQLCRLVMLRDGQKMFAFSRYRPNPPSRWRRPDRNNFTQILSHSALSQLMRMQGYCIVYTHLGLPDNDETPLLNKASIAALESLSRLYHEGHIWVAPASQILHWNILRQHLVLRYSNNAGTCIIDIDAIEDPLCGKRSLSFSECAGLSFYCSDPAETIIRIGGIKAPANCSPADRTGRKCISIAAAPAPSLDILE